MPPNKSINRIREPVSLITYPMNSAEQLPSYAGLKARQSHDFI